jgi:hypothetical protein
VSNHFSRHRGIDSGGQDKTDAYKESEYRQRPRLARVALTMRDSFHLAHSEHNGDNAIKHKIDLCFVVATTLSRESHRAHLVNQKRLTVLKVVD